MVHDAKSSHIGGCLSVADILAVLYGGILTVDSLRPDWTDRDRFILSKGHSAAALYVALAQRKFFPLEWLGGFYKDGCELPGHVTVSVPGIDDSTGSLGHGLPIGCGMAIAVKCDGQTHRVFVLLSDGECDEGSTWEAALFAPHHKLDNLVAIIDYNKIQSFGAVEEVLNLAPLAQKWKAFGWAVREIDGHDLNQIDDALSSVPFEVGRPSCVVANTVKGKGVSFMEGQLAWHYRTPNDEDLALALKEIE